MKISVFLSYPGPFHPKQEEFRDKVKEYLKSRGLAPRTIGVSDFDTDEPLVGIRRLMMESNGILTIAFRRAYIAEGNSKPGPNAKALDGNWITSPWSQIEPAMAFMIGLPTLILREKGVAEEGVLEKGIAGIYLPEFDLGYDHDWKAPKENLTVKRGPNKKKQDNPKEEDYFGEQEWKQIIGKWEGQVRAVAANKGAPPKLY